MYWDNKQIKVNHLYGIYTPNVKEGDIITVKHIGQWNGVILTINGKELPMDHATFKFPAGGEVVEGKTVWEIVKKEAKWYQRKDDPGIYRRVVDYPDWVRSTSKERVISDRDSDKGDYDDCKGIQIDILRSDYYDTTKEQFMDKINPYLPSSHPDRIVVKKVGISEWWQLVDSYGTVTLYCKATEKDGDIIKGDYYVECRSDGWETNNRKFNFYAKKANGWSRMSDNQILDLEREMEEWLANQKKKKLTLGWAKCITNDKTYYAKIVNIESGPAPCAYYHNHIAGGIYATSISRYTCYADHFENVDVEEIQQWLPSGHPDKIKIEKKSKEVQLGWFQSIHDQHMFAKVYRLGGIDYANESITDGIYEDKEAWTPGMSHWKPVDTELVSSLLPDGHKDKIEKPKKPWWDHSSSMGDDGLEHVGYGQAGTGKTVSIELNDSHRSESWRAQMREAFNKVPDHIGIKDPYKLLKLMSKGESITVPKDTSMNLSPEDVWRFKQELGKSARIPVKRKPKFEYIKCKKLPPLP